MRTLSATALAAMYALQTSEVFLMLVEISHPSWLSADYIRLVRNTSDITHNGNTYLAYPLIAELPDEVEDQIPQATIGIDATDQTMVQRLDPLTSPATVTIKVIRASAPNTIEIGTVSFKLKEYVVEEDVLQGTLMLDLPIDEPFPGNTFNPKDFPGLFR